MTRTTCFFLALVAASCGGSSTPNGDSDAGADARVTTSATCAEMAAALCARAAECAGDGSAPVQLSPGGAIVYESEAYCTEVFTEQCGPDVPATYHPLVRDPITCAAELASATCEDDALRVGPACGFRD